MYQRYRHHVESSTSLPLKVHNFTRHANVELSCEELKRRIEDMSTNMRRRANDPLPCTLLRNQRNCVAYENEDEETSWNTVLKGGYAEAANLTLEEKLLLPASVRSILVDKCLNLITPYYFFDIGLCPQLQALFKLSTSNSYSLPFPLKTEHIT